MFDLKKKEIKKTVSFVLTEEIEEQLKERAKLKNMSVSEYVRNCLEYAIQADIEHDSKSKK